MSSYTTGNFLKNIRPFLSSVSIKQNDEYVDCGASIRRRTCDDGGPGGAGDGGVAAALPLAASTAGAHHLEVDPIFVFPFLVDGGGTAGHKWLNGAPAAGPLGLFLQVALAPPDDHPQVTHIVGLERSPEDVGRIPERPEQLVRLVAGGHMIPRQDCM